MEDPSIKRRIRIGKQIGLTTAVKEKKQSGSLNPDWCESLMGFPIGWTDIEVDEPDDRTSLINPDAPEWLEGLKYIGDPDDSGAPRVTTDSKNRGPRLKGLGNAVVPQIPEIFGRAIIEITEQREKDNGKCRK